MNEGCNKYFWYRLNLIIIFLSDCLVCKMSGKSTQSGVKVENDL